MGKIAVLASGSGSNFQALAEAFSFTRHSVAGLICDRRDAYCLARADALNIPAVHISYFRRNREEAEGDILQMIRKWQVDLVVLAGFMRLLSPEFVDALKGQIVNIHPSLLPRHPGTRGIRDCFESGDPEAGITIHYVDHGMDTGPIIRQEKFLRNPGETLEKLERRIHAMEHRCYPETILTLLTERERTGTGRPSGQ